MADNPNRVYSITVTVQPGTLPAVPLSTPWVTEDNTIISIEFEVPPGHNGLTGVRIMKGDTQLLPFTANTWLIANDYTRVFAINDYVPTRDIKVQAYNQGSFAHSFYLRMTMTDYIQGPGVSSPTEQGALTFAAISPVPDPLSPDGLLGADTVAALATGQITASDLAGIDTATLIPANAPA